MTEKTAEEKLRQALEGNITENSTHGQSQEKRKPKPRARTKSQPRADMPENLGQRVDSFMEDFERRIEQSLNAVNLPSEPREMSRTFPRRTPKHETPRKPEPLPEIAQPKPIHESAHAETVNDSLSAHEIISPKPETVPEIAQPATMREPAHAETVNDSQPIQEIISPEIEPVPEIVQPKPIHEPSYAETVNDSQPAHEIISPEIEPIPETVPAMNDTSETPEIPEAVPEESVIIPDIVPADDSLTEHELPEIPVIEADFDQPQNDSNIQELEGDLPDIPVITPDDNGEADDFPGDFIDETPADDFTQEEENPAPENIIDETENESQTGFQEAELFEAVQNDDDFADVDDFSDEPIDEEPAPAEADTSTETDNSQEDFSPTADLSVKVDDALPQISARERKENDTETESAPVTVTMPETIDTAEDKLMADLAEAMTGSPLNLGAQEQPGLYPLPEDFLANVPDAPDSQQSAEDKLKANIAQALSESPITAAQDNASQSLEDDINPFDDIPIPDTLIQRSDDTEPEQSQEEETPPEIPADDETDGQPADDEFLPDFNADTENDSQNDDDSDAPNDPFTIPDFGDDETETESTSDFEPDTVPEKEPEPETTAEFLPETETESETASDFDLLPEAGTVPEAGTETEPETGPDFDTLPEIEPEPENTADDDLPFPAEDEKTPEDTLIPSEPLTEQESLEREIAAITQELEPQENITDTEPQTDITKEEAQPENKMPEDSLINDNAHDDSNNDDWDISALGELGAAATIPGDDPDDFHADKETVTEMITQPENISENAGISQSPENDHKEKTMDIREKLAKRKKGNSDTSSSSSSSGKLAGILTPLLLGAVAVIGGLMLWQIMTLSDKVTSLAMNSPDFEPSARVEANPSYDYAIDFILDPNLTDRMAQRGREGWQVVGSRRTQDSTTGQYGYEFIFMRRTPGR